MTTIATDGKSMAGDGLTSWQGTITREDASKVFRLSDGRVLGCCGPTSEFEVMRDRIEAGGEWAATPKLSDDITALVIGNDGIRLYAGDGTFTRFNCPMAIGSGMDFALIAMDMGCSPEQAVAKAASRDINTGGKITTLHLEAQIREVA